MAREKRQKDGTDVHLVDTEGNQLQDVLDSLRISRAEAARRSNVTVAVINRILERQKVRREKFLSVASGLNVKPEDLLPNW